MLFQVGESAKQGAIYEAGVAAASGDAAVLSEAEAYASGVAVAAESGAISTAEAYADAGISGAIVTAEAYTDIAVSGAESGAIAIAETYTDTAISGYFTTPPTTPLTGAQLDELYELSQEIDILDDVVVLNPASGVFDLGDVIPSGAVIFSAQVRLDTAVTGAGGATKVGLGTDADPDKYGKTASLLSGQLINTIPLWTILTGVETIKLFAVDNDGVATGTIGGVGEGATVRVTYTTMVPLA